MMSTLQKCYGFKQISESFCTILGKLVIELELYVCRKGLQGKGPT